MSRQHAALELAERAYREGGSDPEWLEQMRGIFGKLLPESELQATAAIFQADGAGDVQVQSFAGDLTQLAELQRCLASVDATQRRRTFAAGPVVQLSERIPADSKAWEILHQNRVQEIVGFVCRDSGPLGCFVALSYERRIHLGEPEREPLGRVAAHVATALRLRLRQGATEAVLSSDGQVLDARGEARGADSREALRFAARSLDRSRRRSRRDPEQALETWRALVQGRWSLVERFDTDGRRLWIARENEPPSISERRLTELEQRVVGFLVVGHAQKLIAYELGLSEGNVSRQVTSACRKLGVSRAELVELYTTLIDDQVCSAR